MHDVLVETRDAISRNLSEIADILDVNVKVSKKVTPPSIVGEESYDIKETIRYIKNYIAAQGFDYSGDTIENLYLSLKTKPFVILAGISGTGKSKLVKLFAEAIDAKYKMIPVRPDWSDPSDLLGHNDLSGSFISGKMLDFIRETEQDPNNKPYILCLDEMNLARVEHYFSDILSIIETRKIVDDHINTEFIKPGNGECFMFPENLYIVGTVNMDETTFPFSKKVLDRANTIEFNEVNLTSAPTKSDVEKLPQQNDFLRANYVTLADCGENELITTVCNNLVEINKVLKESNAHVGYRVRDEIVFYMLNNAESGLLEEDNAMDNAIMQKILPRIQGSSKGVKDILNGLAEICKDKYPKCEKKIAFMLRKFEEDGFTTYWL